METETQNEKIAPIGVPGKFVAWVSDLLDTWESNHKTLLNKKVYFSSFTVLCPARNKVYHLLLNLSWTAAETSKWLQMHNLI